MRKLLVALFALSLTGLTACGPEESDLEELIDESGYEDLAVEEASLSGAYDSIAEAADYRHINNRRTAAGKRALNRRACLNTVARKWTYKMAVAGTISHNPNYANQITYYCGPKGLHWKRAGENVGVGGSEQSIFDAFMASPDHKANIMNSYYDSVGIGAYKVTDGRLYITQVFADF